MTPRTRINPIGVRKVEGELDPARNEHFQSDNSRRTPSSTARSGVAAVAPEIYWIPEVVTGRLDLMARPRAGDWLRDEISAWREASVSVVISLLETSEIVELDLRDEVFARLTLAPPGLGSRHADSDTVAFHICAPRTPHRLRRLRVQH